MPNIERFTLPFMLPVEMQCAVFAILLTAWEMELDHAGDLRSYTLRTRHAAIRGYRFYQRMEPYFSNFMRLVNDLAKEPDFKTYPLVSHLTYPWLGGNLCLPNQQSGAEAVLGPNFLRNYYLQQLDWTMGVFNLWNNIEFRKRPDLQDQLDFDGVAFHQMRSKWRQDVHLFPRPASRVSLWPDFDPAWWKFDKYFSADGLPRPEER